MSLRDLLTVNLFLPLTDGVLSYQSFALGAMEANPVVAASILNWGMIWGLIYNKALACLLLLVIFALRHRPFTHTQGIDRDGLGICVHHYRLSLAALSITLLILRLRRL